MRKRTFAGCFQKEVSHTEMWTVNFQLNKISGQASVHYILSTFAIGNIVRHATSFEEYISNIYTLMTKTYQ